MIRDYARSRPASVSTGADRRQRGRAASSRASAQLGDALGRAASTCRPGRDGRGGRGAGTGAARRRARRPCRRAGRAPPSPSAARPARRATPRRRRPAPSGPAEDDPGGGGRGAGDALEQTTDLDPFGQLARPGERCVDGPERDRARRRAHRGRGHHRADHLRRRRPCTSSSMTTRPGLGEESVAGAVEAVDVGLEPVPQRDARHAEIALAGVTDEAGKQLVLLLVEAVDVLGDDRAEQHRAVRGAARRQVARVERDAPGRLCRRVCRTFSSARRGRLRCAASIVT